MGDSGFKIKPWHILVLALIAGIFFGYITIPGLNWGQQGVEPVDLICPYDALHFSSQAAYNAHMSSVHGQTPVTPTTHPAAQIQAQVVDAITSAGVTTATVSVDFGKASSGVFNLLTQADTMTHATNPDIYNVFWADGSEAIIHVDCTGNPTGGLDYYDAWFYVNVHEGNSIYKLTPAMLTQVTGSPSYTYRISLAGAQTTGSVVTWTSGTTNYWDIGVLPIMPRVNASNLNFYISYSGTTLTSVTDGSTWVTGSSTANATLAGNTEHIDVLMTMDVTNVGYAFDVYGVTVQGQFVTYSPYMIFTTNMTAVDAAQLNAEGWIPISDSTLYAEKAYAKKIGPFSTTKGSICSVPVQQIPVYCAAAAAGRYIFKLWVIDMQLTTSVPIGQVSTTMPTAYGMMTAYSAGAAIEAKAYSTASGVGSGEMLDAWATKS